MVFQSGVVACTCGDVRWEMFVEVFLVADEKSDDKGTDKGSDGPEGVQAVQHRPVPLGVLPHRYQVQRSGCVEK